MCEQQSTAVKRTGEPRGVVWRTSMERSGIWIMDPREEALRLEGEHTQMGTDQVEKIARTNVS